MFENKLLFLTPYKIIAVFFILNQSANFSHFFVTLLECLKGFHPSIDHPGLLKNIILLYYYYYLKKRHRFLGIHIKIIDLFFVGIQQAYSLVENLHLKLIKVPQTIYEGTHFLLRNKKTKTKPKYKSHMKESHEWQTFSFTSNNYIQLFCPKVSSKQILFWTEKRKKLNNLLQTGASSYQCIRTYPFIFFSNVTYTNQKKLRETWGRGY